MPMNLLQLILNERSLALITEEIVSDEKVVKSESEKETLESMEEL